jgi:hypothetical protein
MGRALTSVGDLYGLQKLAHNLCWLDMTHGSYLTFIGYHSCRRKLLPPTEDSEIPVVKQTLKSSYQAK